MTLPSSSGTVPSIYLDTCVISGVVRGDMRPEDQTAFVHIAEMVRDSRLTVCASTVAREEIDKIPPEYRGAHLAEYNALQIVRGSNATWLDDNPSSTGFGTVIEHSHYAVLRRIVPDENDARHLFQAKMAGVTNVVTVDYRSILGNAAQLEAQVGIKVYSPAEYVSGSSG